MSILIPVIQPTMSRRSPILCIVLALLVCCQPIWAMAQGCCCVAQAGIASQAEVSAESKPVRCPRCREAQTEAARQNQSGTLTRKCECRTEAKPAVLVARKWSVDKPMAVRLPRAITVAPDLFPQRVQMTVELPESLSGRDVRLRHCSWLA